MLDVPLLPLIGTPNNSDRTNAAPFIKGTKEGTETVLKRWPREGKQRGAVYGGLARGDIRLLSVPARD